MVTVITILFSLSVNFVFENIFELRHRNRFGLWLRLEKDPRKLEQIRKTIGYNTYQSEKAIEEAKKQGLKYKPIQLSNGDTPKQLLARSRYIIVLSIRNDS